MGKVNCEICDRSFKNQEGLDLHNSAKHSVKVEEKKIDENKKWGIWFFVIIGVVIVGIFSLSFIGTSGKYDDFAQCTSEVGAKFYGAYWCSACSQQKSLFGASIKNVNYIECSLPNKGGQNDICNNAGIESYPTWEFSDGTRLQGVQSLSVLSQKTGCNLKIMCMEGKV
jgi:hypothetical protein